MTLNDLANRRFQPLSHVSVRPCFGQTFILADEQTLSSFGHQTGHKRCKERLDRLDFCEENTEVTDIALRMGPISRTVRSIWTVAIVLSFCAFIEARSTDVDIEPGSTVNVSSPLGIVKGVVKDANGSPIADASVAIFHSGTTKLLKQVSSGRDGSFLAKIVPGKYTILAVAFGFNPSYIFGVDVGRSSEIVHGFKLERAGSGNTLPEKRLDRNSSKWRIRAAQMQRAIYQNREGKDPSTADAEVAAEDADREEDRSGRNTQTVVETYFAGTDAGNFKGLNFATSIPVGETSSLMIAGQAGTNRLAPQRIEAAFKFAPVDDHKLHITSSIGRLGSLALDNETKTLGQISFQALDEWKVREGIILVYGLDYSRFVGAGDDDTLSPRLGFQFDIDPRTRFRSSLTSQTEQKTWASALDLEGQNLAFAEPVAIDDVLLDNGKPRLNRTRRVEFGIERILDGRSSVEANAFFDTSFGRGVGLSSVAFDGLGESSFGEFVADQQGQAKGIRVVYTRRLSSRFSTTAGYSFGNGQKLSTAAITEPGNVFEQDFFHTFFAQVAADLRTGTSVRTIYRLSPQATVFAIDPFKGRLAIYDPGLSVYVTQSLPNLGLPFRAEAIVDARNLFDIQSFVANEEGSLMLNAHRRMVRGGIQVRF